jgi:HSP20 family protein
MHVIRYQPWNPMDQFVNRLLDGQGIRHQGAAADWTPSMDIKEETERFLIHADVPGVDPKDIEVSMEDGVLTISGERKVEEREESAGWTRTERHTGRFLRRFTLPETANPEGISAKGEHGSLEIIIPKQAKAASRKIAVNVTAAN